MQLQKWTFPDLNDFTIPPPTPPHPQTKAVKNKASKVSSFKLSLELVAALKLCFSNFNLQEEEIVKSWVGGGFLSFLRYNISFVIFEYFAGGSIQILLYPFLPKLKAI